MSTPDTERTPSGLAYSVVGSGPPLLWLSGYVVASTALAPYAAAFSDAFTCIMFDARGCGSTKPAACRRQTTTSMAYDALEVLRHVGHESAHIHGLSLGGMVAQEIAIRAPGRVRTLVLGATTAGGTATTPARLSTLYSSIYGAHSTVPGYESVDWRGAFQQALAASTHDAVGRLGRVQAPTLVVHGERDRLLPPDNAVSLARLDPGAHLQLVPGAGHFYPMTAGNEASRLMLRWMEARGDVPPGGRTPRQQLGNFVLDVAATPARWTRAQLMPFRHTYRTLR